MDIGIEDFFMHFCEAIFLDDFGGIKMKKVVKNVVVYHHTASGRFEIRNLVS